MDFSNNAAGCTLLGYVSDEEKVNAEIRKAFDWMLADQVLRAALQHGRRVNVTMWFERGKAVRGPFVETLP